MLCWITCTQPYWAASYPIGMPHCLAGYNILRNNNVSLIALICELGRSGNDGGGVLVTNRPCSLSLQHPYYGTATVAGSGETLLMTTTENLRTQLREQSLPSRDDVSIRGEDYTPLHIASPCQISVCETLMKWSSALRICML